MKRKVSTILLIIFLAAGVLGIASVIASQSVMNGMSQAYNQAAMAFTQKESNIEVAFAGFGPGQETSNAATAFLQSIPGGNKQNSNIVIIDEKGNILYKANDSFLHGMTGPLGIAGNESFDVIMDKATGGKFWFTNCGLYNTANAVNYSFETDTPGVLGNADSSQENLNQYSGMLNAYRVVNKPEADLAVIAFNSNQGNSNNQNNSKYDLLWFRTVETDRAIEASFGSNGTSEFESIESVGVVLILLYWLLAPVWTFLDARRRQIQPLPWALLVLLTNVVGLIVYWIVQTQYGKAALRNACPACGKPVQKEHLYCPWCASPLARFCKGCGRALEKDWVACPWCGRPGDGQSQG